MTESKQTTKESDNTSLELLRLTTAGSVDDGKSTLIGRLMYDTKTIFEDQLNSIERTSKQRGDGHLDLALLTDGLRAEREQGITIDVAYRYFSTTRRKFIISDTPGHIQYTRNMVTGASTANLAIILVDARKGVIEQTCRHSFIASLLGIRHVTIAINKMDLVDWSEERYDEIVSEYKNFASRLNIPEITFIPISALHGDNVVERSERMPWYQSSTLLFHLETVYVGRDDNLMDARMPVQYVIRPHTEQWHDFRGFAGRVASGVFKTGEEVTVLPSGFKARIETLYHSEKEVPEAYGPMSVVLTLDKDIDISRGDMLVKPQNQPTVGQDIDLMVCWFSSDQHLREKDRYVLYHTTNKCGVIIEKLLYTVDVNTLHRKEAQGMVELNEIARIKIRTERPLFYDSYQKNRITGSVVLVDEYSNETVAAGMIK